MTSEELINKTLNLLRTTEVELESTSFPGMPLRKEHTYYEDGEMIDLDDSVFDSITNYEDLMNIRDEYKVSEVYIDEEEHSINFRIEKLVEGEETNISEDFAKMTDRIDDIYYAENKHFSY